MRRKRSSSLHQGHQGNLINVHAVVAGLDGVGKSGKTIDNERLMSRPGYTKSEYHYTLDSSLVLLMALQWIAIYPVFSGIHSCLYNRPARTSLYFATFRCIILLFYAKTTT